MILRVWSVTEGPDLIWTTLVCGYLVDSSVQIIPKSPAQPGGGSFKKEKHIEPIEMKRLWFDVTHFLEELLNAFDWLPHQSN